MSDVRHPSSYRPVLMLATTQRCNYRCMMCFWKNPETARELTLHDPVMPMALFEKALDEALPYCGDVGLTGTGEFLCDPLFLERMEPLKEALRRVGGGRRFYQITNGSLLDEDHLRPLKGLEKVGFNVSIESADFLTYASIRVPGTAAKVLDNILQLRSRLGRLGIHDVDLRITVVIMKRNILLLPQLIDLARKVQAAIHLDHPQGFHPDAVDGESMFHYPNFSNNYLRKCADLARMANVDFHLPPPFATTPEEIKAYFDPEVRRRMRCHQLDSQGPLQVLANGDVILCCKDIRVGNLDETSFHELFHREIYARYRSSIAEGNLLPPCDRCRHLFWSSPFLYESSVYGLDIPPEKRDMNPRPNIEAEGFYDWLPELSEDRIRDEMRKSYIFHGQQRVEEDSFPEVREFNESKARNTYFLSLITSGKRVVVYPCGRNTAWMMNHTILSSANIVGFSDKNSSLHGRSFFERTCVSPAEIADLKPDIVLVITKLYGGQILSELKSLCPDSVEVVDVNALSWNGSSEAVTHAPV